MESRLVPVNAVLDLALTDGLNPAPLARAGWAVAALEVPVRASEEIVVCDVVLFNPQAGHLLAVEAKSGANLEPEQGRRLAALTPELLVIAGGITVPEPVPLRCGVLYACLAENADRICLGADGRVSASRYWPLADRRPGYCGLRRPIRCSQPRSVLLLYGRIRSPGSCPSTTSRLLRHSTSPSAPS